MPTSPRARGGCWKSSPRLSPASSWRPAGPSVNPSESDRKEKLQACPSHGQTLKFQTKP